MPRFVTRLVLAIVSQQTYNIDIHQILKNIFFVGKTLATVHVTRTDASTVVEADDADVDETEHTASEVKAWMAYFLTVISLI